MFTEIINIQLFNMKINKIRGYNELPIGRWLAVEKAQATAGEPIDIQIALLDAVYNIHSEDLPIDGFRQLSATLEWLGEPYKPRPVRSTYVINKRTYTLCRNVGKWTTAQYIDYASISQQPDRLDMQLAIVLVPEGEKYNGNTVAARAAEFREHLTIDIAMDISRFFFLQLAASWRAMVTFSELELKKMARRTNGPKKIAILRQIGALRHSRPNGGGWLL